MPFTIELEEDDYLRKWVEGRLEKARMEGESRGATASVRAALEERFGSLPAWALVRIASASPETALRWIVRSYKASSLEDAMN